MGFAQGDLANGTAIKIREYDRRIAELEAENQRLRGVIKFWYFAGFPTVLFCMFL